MSDVRQLSAAGRRTECRAYQFWDGFDNYNASTELWDALLGLAAPLYSSSYARFTAPAGTVGQGMKCGYTYKQKNLLTQVGTVIFGFAVYLPTLGGEMLDGFQAGVKQWSLYVNTSGEFQFYREDTGGALLATSAPGIFRAGTWHWLDIVITTSTVAGSIAIYIDSPAGAIAVFTASGLNNSQTGNAWIDAIRLGDMSNIFAGAMFDDFHCHDNTGAAPNAVLGDSRIYTKMPNGAGGATNWTPNGASANWQCVDEVPPDDDTSYVSSNTASTVDAYAVHTAGFTATPNGVVTRMYMRKDDASTHTASVGVRSGSTPAFGAPGAVASSYSWLDAFFSIDPNTSAAWTAAGADAAQVAIDEVS